LSKFHRLVDWLAARPQVQEEFTDELTNQLVEILAPRALAVWCKASHTCVTWRGVEDHPEGVMESVSVRGERADILLSLMK